MPDTAPFPPSLFQGDSDGNATRLRKPAQERDNQPGGEEEEDEEEEAGDAPMFRTESPVRAYTPLLAALAVGAALFAVYYMYVLRGVSSEDSEVPLEEVPVEEEVPVDGAGKEEL